MIQTGLTPPQQIVFLKIIWCTDIIFNKKNRIHTSNIVFVLNEKKMVIYAIYMYNSALQQTSAIQNLMRAFIKKPKNCVPIILSIKIL